MICYKDKTFCPFYLLCADPCERALTPEVKEDAEKWAKEIGLDIVPISQYANFPDCFKSIFKGDKNEDND